MGQRTEYTSQHSPWKQFCYCLATLWFCFVFNWTSRATIIVSTGVIASTVCLVGFKRYCHKFTKHLKMRGESKEKKFQFIFYNNNNRLVIFFNLMEPLTFFAWNYHSFSVKHYWSLIVLNKTKSTFYVYFDKLRFFVTLCLIISPSWFVWIAQPWLNTKMDSAQSFKAEVWTIVWGMLWYTIVDDTTLGCCWTSNWLQWKNRHKTGKKTSKTVKINKYLKSAS